MPLPENLCKLARAGILKAEELTDSDELYAGSTGRAARASSGGTKVKSPKKQQPRETPGARGQSKTRGAPQTTRDRNASGKESSGSETELCHYMRSEPVLLAHVGRVGVGALARLSHLSINILVDAIPDKSSAFQHFLDGLSPTSDDECD